MKPNGSLMLLVVTLGLFLKAPADAIVFSNLQGNFLLCGCSLNRGTARHLLNRSLEHFTRGDMSRDELWHCGAYPVAEMIERIIEGRKEDLEDPVDVKAAARFLGVSPSLVYAYVERKQIPHYRMMGRVIRFRISELALWRQQFHVNGGIYE